MRRRFGNIRIWTDNGFVFVAGESGEIYEFVNAAEARERFLGELDRASRRVVNGDLIAEGYDIVTGERVCS